MATFDITRPLDVIRLDVDRRATIPFTITNVTPQTIKARLEVVPANPADAGAFTIEGGADRNLRPGDTQNIRVVVAVPQTAAAGSHKFSLKVVDIESPDDHYNESQSVEFSVPALVADGHLRFPWWLIPAAAVLVIAVGAGGWYLYSHPSVDDYRGKNVAVAETDLARLGMNVTTEFGMLVLESNQDRTVVTQMNGDSPAEGTRRLKRGTPILLKMALRMPRVTGMRPTEATDEIARVGIPKEAVETQPVSGPEATYNQVIKQEPDPAGPPSAGSQKIVLFVNVPPEQVPMPGVVGWKYCDAVREISSKGIVARGQTVPAVEKMGGGGRGGRGWVVSIPIVRQPGIVDSQSIAPGTLVYKGREVEIRYAEPQINCYRFLDVTTRVQAERVFELNK